LKGRAYALIAVANVIGGLTYLGQKLALEALPPATIIFGRNLVALAGMAVWLGMRGGVCWRYARSDWGRLVVLGVLAYAAPLVLGNVGVEWSTAGNGSILILLEPAAILVFSRWLLREHVGVVQVAGIAVGLLGALFIVLEDAPVGDLLAGPHMAGNVVLVIHGVLWGLYSPVMRPLAQRYPALDVTFVAMVVAQLALVPVTVLEWDAWHAGPELGGALAWTAALGLFASFLGTVMWTWSLRHLQATTIAPFVFLQPVAGVLADYLVLGEVLTSSAVAGAGLIAVGVVLVVRRTAHSASAAT